ncbi:DUF927 domain-containing protein [Teichococcus aestuarii]|uniref:DUF927 domain-containing protein n=1 Tax=Teichococcus aestuarii TaxID=568898 RepID=UPI003613A75D
MTNSRDGESGKSNVRRAIEAAEPAQATPSASGNVVPFQPFGRFFKVDESGIWKPASDAEKNAIWICAPMEVLAESRSHEGMGWGLLVRFADRDNNTKDLVIPRRLLAGDGAAVRELLADAGLAIGTSPRPDKRLLSCWGRHDLRHGQQACPAMAGIGLAASLSLCCRRALSA